VKSLPRQYGSASTKEEVDGKSRLFNMDGQFPLPRKTDAVNVCWASRNSDPFDSGPDGVKNFGVLLEIFILWIECWI